MNDKTHYADDDTLARLIKLERVYDAAKIYITRVEQGAPVNTRNARFNVLFNAVKELENG